MESLSINVGDTFTSYSSFRDKLEVFQQETKTQFVTKVGERLAETDCLFEQFRYCVLRLGCKQGQKTHTSKGSGERVNQRTYKVNCPVQMNVRLNRPKGKDAFLKVTKLVMSHENHQVEEMFQFYPEQRRFCNDDADKLILSSKTMKTCERREILGNRHGVTVMLQDVYNKQRKLETENGRPDTDEDRCKEIGEKIVAEGGCVEVGRDGEGDFAYLAFSTKAMLGLFSKFPELLVMDCTYKVNHYLLPLLTIMVVDGEGHGMPVFHAFLAKEDTALIKRCLLFFSQHINISRVSCVIVDKDMSEIAAINSIFPNVPVNLCSFHIYQAVQRHLRKELGRGVSCNKLVLDLFMKQVYTESQTEFEELKLNISSIVPQSLIDYFELNWWSKKNMWAACCNVAVLKFTQTTTNTLESYHSKIKKHVSEKLSLSKCLSALLSFDNDKIVNARIKQIISLNCHVYNHRDNDETEVSITKSLTRFGADIVRHELSIFKNIVYDIMPSDDLDMCIVQYKDRSQTTSVSSCTCSTFGHLRLPCRHIFAVRRFMSICLFDISIVPDRFLLANIDYTNFHEDMPEVNYPVISLTSSTRTVEGRYKKVKGVCERIMNVMSVMGEREFTEKLIHLQSLLDSWSDGEGEVIDAVVVPLPEVVDSVVVPLPEVGNGVVVPLPEVVDGVVVPLPEVVDSVVVPLPEVLDSVVVPLPEVVDGVVVPLPEVGNGVVVPLPEVGNGVVVSYPKFSKIKPRGRPCTKQRFTQKRTRSIPFTYRQLSVQQQCKKLIFAVSNVPSIPTNAITLNDLKMPFSFNDIIMDDAVDISIIKDYFDASAWSFVLQGVTSRRNGGIFSCGHCKEVDDGEIKMIQCECCLLWYHFNCVNYTSKRRVAKWFCDSCL